VAFPQYATEKTDNGVIGETEPICKYPSFCRSATKRSYEILGAALMASCYSELECGIDWICNVGERTAWLDFFPSAIWNCELSKEAK
jgi:hypothetical protein